MAFSEYMNFIKFSWLRCSEARKFGFGWDKFLIRFFISLLTNLSSRKKKSSKKSKKIAQKIIGTSRGFWLTLHFFKLLFLSFYENMNAISKKNFRPLQVLVVCYCNKCGSQHASRFSTQFSSHSPLIDQKKSYLWLPSPNFSSCNRGNKIFINSMARANLNKVDNFKTNCST